MGLLLAKLISIFIFIIILSGCGAKGALYLPKSEVIQKDKGVDLEQQNLSSDKKKTHLKDMKEKDSNNHDD